jgi:hypothetical protein
MKIDKKIGSSHTDHEIDVFGGALELFRLGQQVGRHVLDTCGGREIAQDTVLPIISNRTASKIKTKKTHFRASRLAATLLEYYSS